MRFLPSKTFAAYSFRALLLLALLYVAALEAWLVDDAKITFRQVWNFIHGDGMTYNFGERVQAFTHPAWFFLLSAVGFVTRELFITTAVLSIALSVGAVALLLAAERRICGGGGRLPLLTPALLLLFSVAFCDYMTSGLENPLSYFLVGLLLWLLAPPRHFRPHRHSRVPRHSRASGNPEQEYSAFNKAQRRSRWLFALDSRLRGNDDRAIFVVLALLVLNRFDFAALFLPLALLLAITRTNHSPLEGESARQGQRPQPSRWGVKALLHDIWPGALLLSGWLLFALIYFGSPLPNTFYAKMGGDYPLTMLLSRGAGYFMRILSQDPISFAIIAAGVVCSLLSRRPVPLALAAGQLLYMGFILRTGGDWMPSGRFFAVPVFLAAGQMVLALSHRWIVGGMLLVALTLGALPGRSYPIATATGHFDGVVRAPNAVWRPRYGLFTMSRSRIAPMPRQRPVYYTRDCFAGQSQLTHPMVWRIDFCALTDPFLARLPGIQTQTVGVGHYRRKLPTNYGEYLVGKKANIADETLHGLLHDVSLAARSPDLFTGERLQALWRLNTGYHRGLDLSRYRDPDLILPAVTPDVRFTAPLSALSGRAKRDGRHWKGTNFLPPFLNSLHVELDAPRPAAALQLSLSYMEDYEIHVNGELVATIDRVGPQGRLKNHTVPLPRRMLVESIEIRALGRHWQRAFSVGHLHLR